MIVNNCKQNYWYINLQRFLIYICVMAIVFEPFINYRVVFLSVANMVILGASFLIAILKREVVITCYIKGYSIFAFWCIASIIWSQYSIDAAVSRIIDMIVVLALIFSITQYCKTDEGVCLYRCEKLITFYILCTIIITAICYYAEGSKIFTWSRLGATVFANMSGQTAYTSILVPASFLSIWRFLRGEKKVLYGIVSAFFLVSAVLTGVRKAILIPLIFIYIYFFFKYKKNVLKIVGISILCIVGGIIVLVIIMKHSSTMAYRMNILIQSILNPDITSSALGVSDNSLDMRSNLRMLAVRCFYENPILGVGIGEFRFYSVEHGGYDLYAHNNWLELLADVGIIGFVLFYLNYIKVFARSVTKNNYIGFFLCAFIVTYFIYEYGQVTYYYPIFGLIFGIVFCLAEGYRDYGIEECKNERAI